MSRHLKYVHRSRINIKGGSNAAWVGEDFHMRIVIPLMQIQISFDLTLRQSITSKGKQLIIQLIKLYSCSQKTLLITIVGKPDIRAWAIRWIALVSVRAVLTTKSNQCRVLQYSSWQIAQMTFHIKPEPRTEIVTEP